MVFLKSEAKDLRKKSCAVVFSLPFTYALLRTHSKDLSVYSSSSNASCRAYLALHSLKDLHSLTYCNIITAIVISHQIKILHNVHICTCTGQYNSKPHFAILLPITSLLGTIRVVIFEGLKFCVILNMLQFKIFVSVNICGHRILCFCTLSVTFCQSFISKMHQGLKLCFITLLFDKFNSIQYTFNSSLK